VQADEKKTMSDSAKKTVDFIVNFDRVNGPIDMRVGKNADLRIS
jgi:hypothetical protein